MYRSSLAISGAATFLLSAGTVQAATTMRLQVSRALQEDWHSSLNASPGDSVDIRVLVSWTGGPQTPLGLASVIMQPTVSNWATGLDTFTPLVNNGSGGQFTTPIGAVADAPGQYGRIIPFAAVSTQGGTGPYQPYRGHINGFEGTTYLRIANSTATAWFGGAGNTSGGAGVNIHQFSQAGSDRQAFPLPAFNNQLTDIVIFKFNIRVGALGPALRTMVCDLPLAGLFQQPNPYVSWWGSPTEISGSIRDTPTILPAFIVVPSPASMCVAAAFMGIMTRRRRPTGP
jgi:hypothetical protein